MDGDECCAGWCVMGTMVYRYGLLAPTRNADRVEDQMRRGHAYSNQLVEIERGRRAAIRAVYAEHGDVHRLEQACAAARAAVDAASLVRRTKRSATRTRSETEDDRRAERAARDAYREAKRALADARKATRGDERGQRRSSLRRRRERYRVLAAQLARRYATCVLEDVDLRVFARRAPGTEPAENETARGNRHLAAPSELRGALANAFVGRGGCVAKVDAAYTTRACHVCGLVAEWDQATELTHACECGAAWDQDDNACVIMLERRGVITRAGGARGGAAHGDSAVSSGGKWERVRRMRVEKEALAGGARISGGTDAE